MREFLRGPRRGAGLARRLGEVVSVERLRTRPRPRALGGGCAGRRGRSVARRSRGGRAPPHAVALASASVSRAGRPRLPGRTRTTRRSSGTRTRSTKPCSSIRSMSPVAFDIETSSSSASRLIDISPWCLSSDRTCIWVMLTSPLTSRSSEAQRSSPTEPLEFGHDGLRRVALRRDRPGGRRSGLGSSSRHVKNSTRREYSVNVKCRGGVKRCEFALMIEAQQGLTYAEQLAIARRAEAAGFETLFRSDHYASFPAAPSRHHRRLGGPRRPGARDVDADRAGRAGQPGHVPPPRQLREGGHDGRRDERRADRGRRGRRLERGGAPASWASRSRRSPSAPTCWRSSSRSSTASGPSPTAGRSTAHKAVRGGALRPRPVDVDGRPSGERPRPAADPHRRRGLAARLPDRRALGGRVQLSSTSPEDSPRSRPRSTTPVGPSVATPRRSSARRWSAC